MKILMISLAVSALALSALAQDSVQTNEVSQSSLHRDDATSPTNALKPWRDKKMSNDQQRNPEPKQASQQRRIQLMERELNKIGVTEEEKVQIAALQQSYKEKMEANAQRIAEAQDNLSRLLDDGASMELLEEAIQNVSIAQTEQLRILVRNRIEMERILGKQKREEFMKNARLQFMKHGRRGGAPLPPRPGLPPIPGQEAGPLPPPEASQPPEN